MKQPAVDDMLHDVLDRVDLVVSHALDERNRGRLGEFLNKHPARFGWRGRRRLNACTLVTPALAKRVLATPGLRSRDVAAVADAVLPGYAYDDDIESTLVKLLSHPAADDHAALVVMKWTNAAVLTQELLLVNQRISVLLAARLYRMEALRHSGSVPPLWPEDARPEQNPAATLYQSPKMLRRGLAPWCDRIQAVTQAHTAAFGVLVSLSEQWTGSVEELLETVAGIVAA